jgi:bacterial/archaeal transporter family protein
MAFSDRFPAWLTFSLLTVLCWGLWGIQSKVVVEGISPWTNQVLFPLGVLPLAALALKARDLKRLSGRHAKGAVYGLITGVLGGSGNVAFFLALSRGGKASVVTPLVGLAPLVTVLLALWFLGERLNRTQVGGLMLALAAIYLLST